MKHPLKSGILLPAQVLLLCLMHSQHSAAATSTVVLNPTDDGSIYSSGSIVTGNYLTAAGSVRGVAVFSTNVLVGSIQSAFLEVNPYGLPVAPTGRLYAMAASGSSIVIGQYSGGSDLGLITFPTSITFGQVQRFDVTGFMQALAADHVAFRLETSSGIMTLSSLEFNYGKPAQLVVTLVPEPGSVVLGGVTMGILLLRRRRERTFVNTVGPD